MKKYLIGWGVLVFLCLFGILIRYVLVQQQQEEYEEYELCKSVGCSEATCKLFSHFEGQIKVTCPNGVVLSKY
jgi:hypothetical protein